MKTKLVKASDSVLDEAAEILKNGGIAAIPTETVYGLAANAYVKMFRIMKELRFDIITVVGNGNNDETPVIEHWENAFNPMLVY